MQVSIHGAGGHTEHTDQWTRSFIEAGQRKTPALGVLLAERAGFEYHPPTGTREPKKKRLPRKGSLISQRRGRDSNPRTFVGYTLSKRAR